jgi:GNAT superfamily N-acetyltransferase
MLSGEAERPVWASPEGRLSIVARRSPTPAYVRQLEQASFGTSGLRYRRLGIPDTLGRLPAPAFLELRDDGELVGTYALASRRLSGSAAGAVSRSHGLYRGLLTVRKDRQGTGLGRLLVEQTLDWVGREAARREQAQLSWGCVESRNERSLGLLAARGARSLGTLETMLVYRQWPRPKVALEEIGDPRDAAVDEALAASERDCGLRAAAGGGPFFAVTDDRGIVAGARAVVTRIDMGRIGGYWDWLYAGLLRHVPAARRRFDPRCFTYVRLGDVVVRPGGAPVWHDFLTSLMARHRTHMAMFVLDPRRRASRLLREAGVFGRFAAATRQELVVLARGWQLDPEILDGLAATPLAIGPLDL